MGLNYDLIKERTTKYGTYSKKKEEEEVDVYSKIKNRVNKHGVTFDGVDQGYVNSFFKDASDYISSAKTDYEGVGWSNASSAYDARSSKAQEINSRLGTVRSWLNANKDRLTGENYNSMSTFLDEYSKGSSEVLSAFESAKDFYSHFKTEKEYNEYLAGEKQKEDWANFDLDAGLSELTELNSYLEEARAKQQDIIYLQNYLATGASGSGVENYAGNLQKEFKAWIKSMEDAYLQYDPRNYYDHTTPDPSEELQHNYYNYVLPYKNGKFTVEDYAQLKINRGKRELSEYLSQTEYTNIYDLEQAISEKQGYYDKSKDYQNWLKISSVGNIESDHYDADFEKYAQIGGAIKNPSYSDAHGWLSVGGWTPFGDEVKNIVTFSRDNYDDIAFAEFNGNHTKGSSKYHFMTDEEVNTYNYYLGKGDTKSASKYLEYLDDTLNQRQGGFFAENIKGNKFLESMLAFSTGLEQFAHGIQNLDNLFTGEEIDTFTSATQYAYGEIRANTSGGWGVFYDVLNTSSNMLPSILVGTINPMAGLATMGASIAGNSYAEMIKLGYDRDQALAYTALTTGAEMGLQYLLGGVSSLGGKISGGATNFIANKIDNALARVAIKLGGNMLAEGVEESIQTMLEPWFKSLATGVDFESADIDEILYSGLLGALSAGLLEGGSTIASDVATTKAGKAIQKAGAVDRLAKLGSTFSADSVAYKLAGKVDVNTGAYKIGRLFNEVGATLTEQNMSEIVGFLEEKGVLEKDAKRYAKVLNDAVEGKTLTEKQISALNANPAVAKALVEVIINPNSTVNQRMQGYAEAVRMVKGEATPTEPAQNATKTSQAIDSSVDGETGEDTAKEGVFSYTDDGKTYLKDNPNEEVTIKEISSIKDGEVFVRLENGKEVNAKEVDFSSKDEALMYEMVADLGASPATATAMMDAFNKGKATVSAEDFRADAPAAYKYGLVGYAKGLNKLNLTDKQKGDLFLLGAKQANKNAEAMDEARKNGKGAKEKPLKFEGKQTKKNGIVYEGVNPKSIKGDVQKASLIGVEIIAKSTNLEIHVFKSEKIGKNYYAVINGKTIPAPNGMFRDGNRIYLDINANNDGTMLYTLSHEIGHYIRAWNAKGFKELGDFLFEHYEGGIPVETLIDDEVELLKKQYKAEGRELPSETKLYDIAYEEVVCNALSKMLADENAYIKLAELKKQNKGLWAKIGEAIKSFLDRLKKAIGIYSKYDPSMRNSAMTKGLDMEAFNKLQDMYIKAFVEADANYATQNIEVNDMVRFDSNSQSVSPQFSLRTWKESEYVKAKEESAKKIAKALNVSIDVAKAYIDDINSVAKLIADDRVRLDYEASPFGSAFVGNSEYGGSFDFTTLCKKRRLYTGTFSEIQKRLKDVALTPDDILKIRNMMIERAEEATCGLCYVEGSRANMGKFAKEFIRLYKRDNPNGWTPNMADVNTPDGVESMRINHPNAYEQYEYFWNHYGKLKDSDPALFASQQKPKLYESRKEYKGEITNLFKNDSTVEKKNLNGGIRMQSFSDFEIVHMIDTMQIIMDMSTVGLAGQAYTKVPEFAEAFGATGLKINLSLIAKDVDRNGKLIFDDREGMPHDKAFAIRNKYSENVGTIIVTFTDAQLLAAMSDPRIDFIIPFHRSQWKKGQYTAMGLPKGTKDYTFMQNEKLIKQTYHEYRGKMVKDKASNYMPNEYWDFSKSGKENAEAYLKMCAENNKRPKFYKLLDDKGNGVYALKKDGSTDGYWKLLIDFKMYNNNGVGSPQVGVKPNFSMGEVIRILDEYRGGHASYPIAHDVVDAFINDYKGNNNVEASELADAGTMYSTRVTDKETLDFLENQEHITTYKSFVEIDGKLYSPMATKVKGDDGKYKLTNSSELGVWQQAEEKPDTIPKFHKSGYGYYVLKKDDGGSVTAAYNPYEHSSNLVLNDQFEAAYQRPNLVTVECVIPKSELTSGYKAKYAKDSTGYLDWKSGSVAGKLKGNKRKVYLSRWLKPVRIVPDSEVAKMYKDLVGTEISVPFNVVTPNLLSELEKIGVKIDYDGSAGYQYRQSKTEKSNTKYSTRDSDYFDAVNRGDMGTAQKMVDEAAKKAGYTQKLYHGTNQFGFTKFEGTEGHSYEEIQFFTTDSIETANTYAGTNKVRRVAEEYELDYDIRDEYENKAKDIAGDLASFMSGEIGYYNYIDGDYIFNTVIDGNENQLFDIEDQWLDDIYKSEYSDEYEEFFEFQESAEADQLVNKFHDYLGQIKTIVKALGKYETSGIYEFVANTDNLFVMDAKGKHWNELEDSRLPDRLLHGTKLKYKTRDVCLWAKNQGYAGVLFRNIVDSGDGENVSPSDVYAFFNPREQVKSADPVTYDDNGNIIPLSERFKRANDDIRYSTRDLAPTFYSQMGKVVEGMKQDKFGANSVVSMLRGRGVKAEEIRWSGIATWLEGKKSVTKAELLEFIAGSQLQIGDKEIGGADKPQLWDNFYRQMNDVIPYFSTEEIEEMCFDYDGDFSAEKFKTELEGYVDEVGISEYDFDDAIEYAEEMEKALKGSATQWGQYKLEGGSNYREIVFTMPNSTYTNNAMQAHWGEDAEGVLAHARIQDFVVNGKNMLFIEEIQSDWHNEGREKGYAKKLSAKEEKRLAEIEEDLDRTKKERAKIATEMRNYPLGSNEYNDLVRKTEPLTEKFRELTNEMVKIYGTEDLDNGVPDAPFKDTYHEYVLKRLLRMAAEEGYDSIGWTPADIQSKRWSEDYAEGYRIEYDQEMPKFLKKYGRQWGAKVDKTYIKANNYKEDLVNERIAESKKQLAFYEEDIKQYDPDSEDAEFDRKAIENLKQLLEDLKGTKVWSMDITDSMKDSVLHEGQAMYSVRDSFASQVDDVLNGKFPRGNAVYVGATPKILQDVGLNGDLPMLTTARHIKKATMPKNTKLHQHGLTDEQIKSIPKKVASPVMIMDSLNEGSNSVIVVTDMLDSDGSPVVVSIKADGKGTYNNVDIDTNFVTGYYGRDGFAGFIADNVKKNNFLYINKKKATALSAESTTSWVEQLKNYDFDTIIRKTKVTVKQNSANFQKYSVRDPEDQSNRSLLANALESAAQNDIEKAKLAQYKEKIGLINSEEQKLHDINEQLKELYFTKGKRDAEKIRSLKFEQKQTENRINTYDRQLLNLEASKPLKDVLEREKKLAYKKAEQKGKEALAKQKEKTAKTTREIMTRWQESRRKGVESRHKTKLREEIKKVVGKLDTLLRRPTKDKHVKEDLKNAVADALLAINMDTVGAEARVAMYNEWIANETNPDKIAELTKSRDRIELQGDNLKEKLTALQSAYEKVKNSTDPELKNAYQEPVMNAIKNVSDLVGSTPLRDMNLTQLEAVYEMYSMVLHTVNTANKMFKAKKGETITQTAEAVNEEIRNISKEKFKRNPIVAWLRKIGWSLLKPFTAFRAIGSETFTGLYNNLRSGEDTYYVDVNEAKNFIHEQYEKHNFKEWDKKKTYTFTAKSGKTFTLTLEQVMSLYAYSRRMQAHDHIIEGGIVLEESVIETKNKLGLPVKYKVDTKSAFNISEETLQEICDSLTAEQRAFVEEMQTYLSDVMGAKGNEVSMELLGVKLFKEQFYFPLKSSKYYMGFKPEEAGEIKLKNPAFSKETVQHANNPVVLKNFTDVWATHVNDMSMYHSFVLPLEDFTRVYNYKTKTSANLETMSTEATIANAYGEGATEYIRNFLKSLNGGVRAENVGIVDKLTGLSKKGAVLGSASVMIQQPSAIIRAMALINPKYFVVSTHKSLNLVKHNKDWAELKQYAPIAGIKEMGRFDVGMGQGTVKWIKDQNTLREKADEALSKAPAFMDEITWVNIWHAVKKEVASKNQDLKVGSEAYFKKCGERFTEVISLTQVYDSVFSRSDLMRNKSWIAKAITAFMAEPTTTLNMLVDSVIQGKRTGKVGGFIKFTAGTTGAIVGSIVLNSALKSIITAMRDDDEEESYAEKYVGDFIGNTLDGLNPLTYIPVAKDIWSIFQGYDVGRMDMDMFADLYKAIDAMDSDSKTEYEKWAGLTGAISAFFGVPFKNVERDIRGAYNTIQSFINGERTTDAGIDIAIREALTGEEISNAQQLYEAIISGDKEQIKRVEGRFKNQDDINSAIKKALRDNDSRIKKAAQARYNGNIAEYTRIAKEIIAEGKFKQDIVVGAINAEINAIKRKEEDSKGTTENSSEDNKDQASSIYSASDINVALNNGDTDTAKTIIQDLIDTKVANGKTEQEAKSSLRSSLTSYWKPLYLQAYKNNDTAEMRRIREILRDSGLYGKANEVIKTVQSWLKD